MFLPGCDQPAATLGHIGRVPIRIDATFIFVPLYYASALNPAAPLDSVLYLLIMSTGIFVSILLHEIGHGAVAYRLGMGVGELVIGGFYGYARLSGIAPSRKLAIAVLVAGPLANLAVFAWLWLLLGVPGYSLSHGFGAPLLGVTTIYSYPLLYSAAWSLALMNLALFTFNLMPAFPLDGGRICRLMLSMRMEQERAVQLVAAFGIAFGIFLVVSAGPFSYIGLMVGLMIAWQNYGAFQDPSRAPVD